MQSRIDARREALSLEEARFTKLVLGHVMQ